MILPFKGLFSGLGQFSKTRIFGEVDPFAALALLKTLRNNINSSFLQSAKDKSLSQSGVKVLLKKNVRPQKLT